MRIRYITYITKISNTHHKINEHTSQYFQICTAQDTWLIFQDFEYISQDRRIYISKLSNTRHKINEHT